MSTKNEVKVGDKVKSLVNETVLRRGETYEVTKVTGTAGTINVTDDAGDEHCLFSTEYELVKPVEPKGTFESLLIEALPQGGYEVTAPGHTWGVHHQKLSAHTTLAEAVAFISRNMR